MPNPDMEKIWSIYDTATISIERRDLKFEMSYEDSACNLKIFAGNHLPVSMIDVKDFSDFVERLPEAVDKWEYNLRSYRELSGVSGIGNSIRFWDDFYNNLEHLHGFVDDMKVANEIDKNGFSFTSDKLGIITMSDKDSAFVITSMSAQNFTEFKEEFPTLVKAINFNVLPSRLLDADFYPGYSDVMGSDSHALSFYVGKVDDIKYRLSTLETSLSSLKHFEITDDVAKKVFRELEQEDNSYANEACAVLDMSDVGKKSSSHVNSR